jgi:inhibitor of KinA sporulation pathway (predicted exonuclease)
MAKIVKLVDPKEVQAARDYVELKRKFYAHLAHVQQKQKDELESLSAGFTKKFREAFIRFGHKHMPDPEGAFARNEYYLIHDYLEEHGDVYLVKQVEWNAPEPPVEPKNHSELFDTDTLH